MTHQNHVMELVSVDSNGIQEWLCRTCHRRLRFNWSAAAAPTVVEPGDDGVLHVGPQVKPALVEHESGLSALWLMAITNLDLSVLTESEDDGKLPL
ncbi:MAG: hypothetical protein RRC07_02630 [Anaerolineae bacterium]|nr:hypothetical protein [Anaerolineae bacterium]